MKIKFYSKSLGRKVFLKLNTNSRKKAKKIKTKLSNCNYDVCYKFVEELISKGL